MRIKCICIDDAMKPNEIPDSKWPKKGQFYHISYIWVMAMQGGIQGCELSEFDISDYAPYNCYRLSRFAILESDLENFISLCKACGEMNGVTPDLSKVRELIEVQS